jgi:hypothetical protein
VKWDYRTDIVDLALTDERQALVGSSAQLLAEQSTPERVRAAEPVGFDPSLSAALAEVGAVAIGVPEARGGWGASLLDLGLVAEQTEVWASAPGHDGTAPIERDDVRRRLIRAAIAMAAQVSDELVGTGGRRLTPEVPMDGQAPDELGGTGGRRLTPEVPMDGRARGRAVLPTGEAG